MSTENSNTKQPCTIDSFVGSNTWGAKFQKIIAKTSEARVHLLGAWWNINDFELDCGLFRLDVMGMLEVHHMVDCERIEMDGVEYTIEDVYE
tara:strand:+ start:1808 stop:2083 length:276 start_codon:yes stop_codon:yes gene_type:complete